jgi:hypothetical protein
MATQVSDSLFEIDPRELEESLTSDSELSLLEEPDPDVVKRFDALLDASEDALADGDGVRALAELDGEYRASLAELWQRVSYGGASLDSSRGYLFGRLQLALLQGQVGVLCAPGREPLTCTSYHLAVGLRLLYEAAVYEDGAEPLDDDWLVEDEQVYLWAVTEDAKLGDWSSFLLGGGLVEVPHELAVKLAGQDVVDFLIREKRMLETRDLDAVPLAAWRQQAPPVLARRLALVAEHATNLADKRSDELGREWDDARRARVGRLEARLERAAEQGLDSAMMASVDEAIAAVMRQRVVFRHEVLATQLFLVTS